MRWTPILFDVAVASGVWTASLRLERHWRAQVTADPSPGNTRSYHLDRAALFCATTGFTFFLTWLITDTVGPGWLHVLARPATGVLLAVAAALSGWAAWIKAR